MIAEGTFLRNGTLRRCAARTAISGSRQAHLDLHYADIMRVRDGKVFYHAVYFDSAEMMGQLELLPAASGATA